MRSAATAGTRDRPELALDREQLRRVAQFHAAVLAFYAVDGLFFAALGLAGAVPLTFGPLYMAAGCLSAAVNVLLFRRGAKGMRELDLNNQAMSGCAVVQMLVSALLVPSAGGLMLMSLMTVLAASALQLSRRDLRRMWLAVATGTAVTVFVSADTLAMPMSTPVERLVSGVWFAWLLGKCALINVEGTRLREQAGNANTRLRKALADLQTIATTDELTAIANRRSIVSNLDAAIGPGSKLSRPVAVALFDIDHFKRVNDRFGHAAGDAVLREFASLATRGLRPDDRVGRYGGEEFLLVLNQVETAATARETADRLRRSVESFDWTPVVGDLPVTASAGVALVAPGETAARAIGRADRALYAAKAGGRNQVVLAE